MATNRRSLATTLARTRMAFMDGRSRTGRLWLDTQKQLTAVVGDVAPHQEHLIAVAADHAVRIAALLPKAMDGDTMAAKSLADANEALRRVLVALGIEAKPNGGSQHLGDYLAARYGKPGGKDAA